MKKVLLALTLVFPIAQAMAQVPDTSPPSQVTDLKWLVGSWTGASKFSAGGSDMDMTVTATYSLEGQFLKGVTIYDFSVMKMEETQYVGWDAAKSEYVLHAFTNMAPTARVERGKMEGSKMVCISEPWTIMGQETVNRTTMTKLSDTKVKFTLEFKSGDSWDKVADFELTKK